MKKNNRSLIIVLLIAIATPAAANLAGPPTGGTIKQSVWQEAATVTTAVTDPNSTERNAAYFEANYTTMTIQSSWSYLYLRNSSTTDGDSTAYVIYLSDGYTYLPAFTITFTTGTMVNDRKSGYFFSDGVVVTEFLTSGVVKNPGNNYCGIYWFDRLWARKIGVVPTTVTHAAYLEITGN